MDVQTADNIYATPGANVASAAMQQEYGGFWIRVGAYLIDYIILMIPTYAASFALVYVDPTTIAANLSSIIIGWLYFALQESGSAQATIGKRALGMQVVSLDGERISFGNASGRYFAKILSALGLLLGFMWVGWDAKKQGWHDKLAGTLVVKG